jgi:cytidylate kinase
VLPPSVDDGRQYTVLVGGEDVTAALRAPEVERSVSRVAGYPGVRRALISRQQAIGRRGRVVMVGRDIGSVVMPEAELKIFLQATLDERARRRAAEGGQPAAVERVRDEIARRDGLDEHVMRPAADAVLLNTDGLSPDDEVAWILNYIARGP